MPVAWSGTDDNSASWKLYEPDGKQRQAVNYGTGNGNVVVQLRADEFGRVAKLVERLAAAGHKIAVEAIPAELKVLLRDAPADGEQVRDAQLRQAS